MLRWVVIGTALGGCSTESTYYCLADTQCGRDGVCESPGWCSFPDLACESGRRFGDYAGEDSRGECVPPGWGGSSDGIADDGATATSGTGSEGGPGSFDGDATGDADDETTTDPATSYGSTDDTCSQGCDETTESDTETASTGFVEACDVSIRDDFDDGSLADWILNTSPHDASEENGVLRIDAVAGVADDQDVFKVIETHGRAVMVLHVAEPPPEDVLFQLLFHADLFGVDTSEFYGWTVVGGDVRVLGDVVTPLGDIRWLRIRIDDDAVSFDSSTDGRRWDEQASVSLPEPATGFGIHLQGQTVQPLAAPETLAFESIDICLR